MTMDLDRLQEALKDFDKRVKKEVCPVLDDFLCHVAKTGETILMLISKIREGLSPSEGNQPIKSK